MKVATKIAVGLLLTSQVSAQDTLWEEMELYKAATVQGEEIPNRDVTEADAVEGLKLPMHDVGSIYSGGGATTTPAYPTNVNPASALPSIDLSTLPKEWYFDQYTERAKREGKPLDWYVNIARASAIEEAKLSKNARDNLVMCGGGFDIWGDSGRCNVFTNQVSCEQNFDSCKDNLKNESDKNVAAAETFRQLRIENAYLRSLIPAKKLRR